MQDCYKENSISRWPSVSRVLVDSFHLNRQALLFCRSTCGFQLFLLAPNYTFQLYPDTKGGKKWNKLEGMGYRYQKLEGETCSTRWKFEVLLGRIMVDGRVCGNPCRPVSRESRKAVLTLEFGPLVSLERSTPFARSRARTSNNKNHAPFSRPAPVFVFRADFDPLAWNDPRERSWKASEIVVAALLSRNNSRITELIVQILDIVVASKFYLPTDTSTISIKSDFIDATRPRFLSRQVSLFRSNYKIRIRARGMLKTRKCTPVNYINFEGVLVGYVRAKAIVPLQDSNVNHAPCPRTVQQQTLAPNRDRADSRPSRDHRAANCAFMIAALRLKTWRSTSSIDLSSTIPVVERFARTVSVGTDRETGRTRSRGRSSRWRPRESR